MCDELAQTILVGFLNIVKVIPIKMKTSAFILTCPPSPELIANTYTTSNIGED